MENIIYNELIERGYDVDVGIVEINEKNAKGNYVSKQLETDFVCNKIDEKIYIQSAYRMETKEKQKQEKRSLLNIQRRLLKKSSSSKTISNVISPKTGLKLSVLRNGF